MKTRPDILKIRYIFAFHGEREVVSSHVFFYIPEIEARSELHFSLGVFRETYVKCCQMIKFWQQSCLCCYYQLPAIVLHRDEIELENSKHSFHTRSVFIGMQGMSNIS